MSIDPNYVAAVPNVAALQALGADSPNYGPVYVKGYYSAGDGGQGVFFWNATSTANPNNGTIFQATGVSLGRWVREVTGPINVCWFGAVGDGATDSTAAIQRALNLGMSTFVPDGNYLVTDTLTLTTPWQELYGAGRGSSQIIFSFTTGKIGLNVQPLNMVPPENIIIRDLHLSGVANVTQLVNVGGPQIQILSNRLVNSSARGHVIYLQPENQDANIFNFGARISLNEIYGSLSGGSGGGFGIYLGNNNQTTSICFNTIENNSTHIYLNGATAQLTVDSNVLQRCGTSQQAVYINNDTSSEPLPCYDVNFTRNYIEQAQYAFVVGRMNIDTLRISDNYAYRNEDSTTKHSSGFFVTGDGTVCNSPSIWVENNHVEAYNAIFVLGGEVGARNLVSTKGNCIGPNTSEWSVGSYRDHAFDIRVFNPLFLKTIVSGTISSQTILRTESLTCEYQVPIQWSGGEIPDSVRFFYIPIGNAKVTLSLVKIDTSVSKPTVTTVATKTFNVEGWCQLDLSTIGLPEPHMEYLLDVSTSGGTTSYVYPMNLYLRQ